MEFIEDLNETEYENFVIQNQKGHFMQSYYWGNVATVKHFKPHYLGIKKDGKLIAAALLLEKHLIRKYSFFYCPRGFVGNFEDSETLKEMTSFLKKYCKKRNGIFLRIDPDIPLQKLDNEGNVLKELNYPLVEELKKLGFKHNGFNKNFESDQPRYTFRLDISEGMEAVRKNMHPTTRNIINRGNTFKLNIYKGTIEDIKDFYDTMIETAERENLVLSPIEYYKNFYEQLHKHNMSDIYLIKVNIEELRNIYQEKLSSLQKDIDTIQNSNKKRKENQLKDLNDQLEKNKKELEDLKNIQEKEIVLSSVITSKYQNKVWITHGGNKSCLRYLNANYLLYYYVIEDAYKEGYTMIDFFGTTGEPKKDNTIYGIHLFKKRFGGEYMEFIGQFDYVIHPILYFGYRRIFPKIRKFLRK